MTVRCMRAPLAALAVAVALAGCAGGGGGEEGSSAATDPATPAGAPFTAQGTGPAMSASQAASTLGAPSAVDPARAGETLSGYDTFGPPKDIFVQQVADSSGTAAASEPSSGGVPSTTPTVPVVSPPGGPTPPSVSVGGGGQPSTGGPGGSSTPDVPVSSPRALEADFDVSGEPVVAREGDSIPPDTQQFTVKTIGARSVALQLNAGLLPDGSDTITLDEGESIRLYNQTAHKGYTIKLVDIRSVS